MLYADIINISHNEILKFYKNKVCLFLNSQIFTNYNTRWRFCSEFVKFIFFFQNKRFQKEFSIK